MPRLARGGRSNGAARYSKAVRGVSLFAALMIGLQLGRFFIAAQMDPLLCPWDLPEASAAGSGHTHHDEASLAIPVGADSGYTLEHCKDSFYGVNLTPVQTLALPVMNLTTDPETRWASPGLLVLLASEANLPEPFQPPRTIS